MSAITLICQRCSKPIRRDGGCLRVSYGALTAYGAAEAQWKREHPGTVHNLAELITFPDAVRWETCHDACRREDDRDDYYEIASDQVRTWAELTHWTAHLLGKNWLTDTDWAQVLREAAEDTPATRISAVRSVAA